MWQTSNHTHKELQSYFISAGFLNLQLVKCSYVLSILTLCQGKEEASKRPLMPAGWKPPIFHFYCHQLPEGYVQPPDMVWCPTIPISQPKEVLKAQIPCLKSYFPHLVYPPIPTSSSHDRYSLCSMGHQLRDAAPWFLHCALPFTSLVELLEEDTCDFQGLPFS